MLPLSLETQVPIALAYHSQSYIRMFLLQKVMKFGNKTVTLHKCFVSNQHKIVAFFVTSENNAKFVLFWVP